MRTLVLQTFFPDLFLERVIYTNFFNSHGKMLKCSHIKKYFNLNKDL
jgi:hypothetical protein